MKKFILLMLLAAGACLQTANSQVVNQGAKITISAGGSFFVNGAFVNQTGTVLNHGRLTVKGDWQNNDQEFTVFNKLSEGVVELSGSDQIIAGDFKTEFPSLTLSGTGIKALRVNTDISGTLSLNDLELKADSYELSILNPSPDAIQRATGFISTDNKGKLVRSLNRASFYLFPLGSSDGGTTLYRPLEVEAKDAVQNALAATFTKKDPSTQGYSRSSKRADIQTVFDKYLYLLDQEGTSDVNIRFYQNSVQDGGYKQLVHWNKFDLWEKAGPSTAVSGAFGDGLNQHLLYSSNQPISNVPFTLTAVNEESPFTFFNAFSPDGDGKNDTWEIKNLDLYPNNELSVFNRWGDEVFKTKNYSSSKAWDGGNLNPGTYYYILKVNENGVDKSYKGFITMMKND
jgi:gliding motility-associated-like protein